MADLTYGIIGCGMMGREHIRNIQLMDGCHIGALYDTSADSLKQAKSCAPEAIVTSSLSELLAIETLDCLVLATPNYLHAEHLRQIAQTRTIPILAEKPLVTNAGDAKLVTSLQNDYGAPIWVAMEYRYMPPVARFLEEIEIATGGVRHLSIREHRFPFLEKVNDWNRFNRLSGGTMVEKCCHFFDLMRLITGSEPVRIMGSGGQAVNHKDELYDGQMPDIWDSAFTVVDFEDASRAVLDICMFAEGSKYQEEISAVGPLGKIECFVPGPTRLWPTERGAPPVPKIVISPRDKSQNVREIFVPVEETLLTAGDHHGSTFYQHQEFREMLMTGGAPRVTLNDGWMAAAMGMAAQTASIEGKVVQFDPMPAGELVDP